MVQVSVFGYVTVDLQLRQGQKQTPYACSGLAGHIDFGSRQKIVYYWAWTWGEDVLWLIHLKTKKGSTIWISGSQELVDCTSQNGDVKTKRLKVHLDNCDFLPDWQSKDQKLSLPDYQETTAPASSLPPLEILDGEHGTLSE